MDLSDLAIESPSKRKREIEEMNAETRSSLLDTDVTQQYLTAEDGACGSPRSNVAYHFQCLELESTPISKLELKGSSLIRIAPTDDSATRKRVKFVEFTPLEIAETLQGDLRNGAEDATGLFEGTSEVKPNASSVVFRGFRTQSKSLSTKLSGPYASVNQQAGFKAQPQRRMGTPPLSGSKNSSLMHEEEVFVYPDQAALTWHDNEITGYDDNDPDDDGEGINGIGFKPTPTEARARMERRKQQMAEYKTREMKEDRARRVEKRRGGTAVSSSRSKKLAARRVRFSEAEVSIMITT